MRLHISAEFGTDLLRATAAPTNSENENENSNGSSGYSSDVESSTDGQETEGSSFVEVTSSSSTSSCDRNCSDNESEDIDYEIAFLKQKQKLLHRAVKAMNREETYDASQARSVVAEDGSNNKKASPIWVEAKAFLSLLNRRDEESGNKRRAETPPPPTIRVATSYSLQESKRPKIDISSVSCIPSKDMETHLKPRISKYEQVIEDMSPATSFTPMGPWVAKALVHCLPSLKLPCDSSRTASCQWAIFKDPNRGSLVLPPSKIPIHNSIELKDAMAFTSVPQ